VSVDSIAVGMYLLIAHLQHSERAAVNNGRARRYATCAPHKFTRLPNPSILVPVSIERRRRQRPTFLPPRSQAVQYELRALKVFSRNQSFLGSKVMTPLVYSPLAVSGFSIFRAAFLILAYFLSSAYNPFHILVKCISIPCRTCCRRNYSICIYVYNHIFRFSGSDHAFCCVADSPSFVMSRFPGFGFPLYEGLAVSLKCDVDSNPPSSPKWMKGDTYALYTYSLFLRLHVLAVQIRIHYGHCGKRFSVFELAHNPSLNERTGRNESHRNLFPPCGGE
jgi:hypothetical protein